MIILKNPSQIEKMRAAGRLLYEVEQKVREAVRPGVTTADLDVLAEQLIRREGDIVSVDCTLLLDGWQADSAFTVGVGEISEAAKRLIIATEECFWQGIRQCVAGKRLGDVGHAVEAQARSYGYQPVREYTGHGIGREMHEDPSVLNYGEPGRGIRLRRGMTLAVEPMICEGDWHVENDPDGWTVRTRDGKLCSHYEHTIAVNEEGLPEILTLPGFSWAETPLNEKGFPRISHLAEA